MVKERIAYKGGLIKAVNIPNVGGDQFQAKIEGASTLQKSIDKVLQFGLARGAARAESAAEDYVVQNPLSYNDVSNLSPEEKQKVFDNQNTVFGAKVKQLRTLGVTLDLELQAKKQLQNTDLEYQKLYAVTGEFDTEAFAQDASAIVDGYTDALAEFDLGESLKLKSSLGITASSYVSAAEKQKIADYKAKRLELAEGTIDADTESIIGLLDNYGAVVETINEDFSVTKITVDDIIDKKINDNFAALVAVGSTKANEYLENTRKAVADAKIGIVNNYYENQTGNLTEIELADIADEFANGEFLGKDKQNVDLIWDNLDDIDKAKVRKNFLTFEEDELKRIERGEQAATKSLQRVLDLLQTEFEFALKNNEYDEANTINDQIYKIDGGVGIKRGFVSEQYSKNNTALENFDGLTDINVYDYLSNGIDSETISYQEIVDNQKNLSRTDFITLKDDFKNTRDAGVKELKNEYAVRFNLVADEDERKRLLSGLRANPTAVNIDILERNNTFETLSVNINKYIRRQQRNNIVVTLQDVETFAETEYKNLTDPNTRRRNVDDLRNNLVNNPILRKDIVLRELEIEFDLDSTEVVGSIFNDRAKLDQLTFYLTNLYKESSDKLAEIGITKEEIDTYRSSVVSLIYKMEMANE